MGGCIFPFRCLSKHRCKYITWGGGGGGSSANLSNLSSFISSTHANNFWSFLQGTFVKEESNKGKVEGSIWCSNVIAFVLQIVMLDKRTQKKCKLRLHPAHHCVHSVFQLPPPHFYPKIWIFWWRIPFKLFNPIVQPCLTIGLSV